MKKKIAIIVLVVLLVGFVAPVLNNMYGWYGTAAEEPELRTEVLGADFGGWIDKEGNLVIDSKVPSSQ
jgi:hypothetical protein